MPRIASPESLSVRKSNLILSCAEQEPNNDRAFWYTSLFAPYGPPQGDFIVTTRGFQVPLRGI